MKEIWVLKEFHFFFAVKQTEQTSSGFTGSMLLNKVEFSALEMASLFDASIKV